MQSTKIRSTPMGESTHGGSLSCQRRTPSTGRPPGQTDLLLRTSNALRPLYTIVQSYCPDSAPGSALLPYLETSLPCNVAYERSARLSTGQSLAKQDLRNICRSFCSTAFSTCHSGRLDVDGGRMRLGSWRPQTIHPFDLAGRRRNPE